LSERTDWTAVGVALLAGVVAAAYVGKLPPAVPLLKADLGLSLVAAGWVASMFNVVAIGGALFVGLFADRIGALRACLAGLGLLVVGGSVGALAPGTGTLLVSRVVEGAGLIAVAVSAPALIATACVAKDRRLALALWSIYMPFGIALSVFASTPVMAAGGWRGLWWAAVAATLVCLFGVYGMRGVYARPPGGGRKLADLIAPLRALAPWAVATAMGAYTLQWMAVMTWLPTFLIQARGASTLVAASLAAVFSVANMVGIVAGSALLERNLPRGTLMIGAFVAMAVCNLAIFSAAAPDLLRYAAVLGLSAFGGIIPAAVMSSSQRYARSPAQVGGLQGLIVQLSNTGQFIGPLAVAAVVSATGRWESALGVCLTASAIGLVIGVVVSRSERRMPVVV
jgi:MFS family permease